MTSRPTVPDFAPGSGQLCLRDRRRASRGAGDRRRHPDIRSAAAAFSVPRRLRRVAVGIPVDQKANQIRDVVVGAGQQYCSVRKYARTSCAVPGMKRRIFGMRRSIAIWRAPAIVPFFLVPRQALQQSNGAAFGLSIAELAEARRSG